MLFSNICTDPTKDWKKRDDGWTELDRKIPVSPYLPPFVIFLFVSLHIIGFGSVSWAALFTALGLVALLKPVRFNPFNQLFVVGMMVMWSAYAIDPLLNHKIFGTLKSGPFRQHVCTGVNPKTKEVCLVFRGGLWGISENSYTFQRGWPFSSGLQRGVPGCDDFEFKNPPPRLGWLEYEP